MNIMKSFFICLMLLLSYPAQSVMAQGQPAKRCEAITKKGTRCKNKAVNKTKYCQVHQAKSPAVMQGVPMQPRFRDIANSTIRCIMKVNYNHLPFSKSRYREKSSIHQMPFWE